MEERAMDDTLLSLLREFVEREAPRGDDVAMPDCLWLRAKRLVEAHDQSVAGPVVVSIQRFLVAEPGRHIGHCVGDDGPDDCAARTTGYCGPKCPSWKNEEDG